MKSPDVKDLYIPLILATAHETKQPIKAAKFMLNEAEKTGIKTELIDVKDMKSALLDNHERDQVIKKFSEKISRADGLIIVSPEYNHGYPGEFKMLLDTLYKEYNHKPVGICGVSNGGMGGARMVEQLRLVFIELKMTPIRESVYFSKVQEIFDENNSIKDSSYHEKAKIFLDELIWYAKALKIARNNEI